MKTIHKTQELLDAGYIFEENTDAIEEVAADFSCAITPAMQQQIQSFDDPIAKQFVPNENELTIKPEDLTDPIGDTPHTKVKGIVHRYPDRCLLQPVHVCPVYCRFCFRREKVGSHQESLTPDEIQQALNYIRENKNIWEVILTGGDPLILKPKMLKNLLIELDRIEHVGVVRLHTRIPIVDPKRITAAMIEVLQLKNKPTYIVIHANHANEFSSENEQACANLVNAGIPLLSQTVLLKSINDDIDSLSALMKKFIQNRIKPYYLHHADLARGTSHFRTTIASGQSLVRQLRGRFSGLCQVTYVLDIPGGFGKAPIQTSCIQQVTECEYSIEDYHGKQHVYKEDS